jgi:hypothetical protein
MNIGKTSDPERVGRPTAVHFLVSGAAGRRLEVGAGLNCQPLIFERVAGLIFRDDVEITILPDLSQGVSLHHLVFVTNVYQLTRDARQVAGVSEDRRGLMAIYREAEAERQAKAAALAAKKDPATGRFAATPKQHRRRKAA